MVLVGLPGSGKSTFVNQAGANAVSSDEMRRVLADDPTDQTIHRRVFAAMRYLVRQRLDLRRPVTYVDATHLTRRERRPYIELGIQYDCEVEGVFFDVPLEVCMERNRLRERVVPEAALREMAGKLRPPTIEEGFASIRVLSIAGLDA